MPVFLAAAAAITSIASGISGFFGANRAAAAARREGVAMSRDAIARGEFDAIGYARNLAQLLGRQRVAIAAQGVDVSSGTAAALRTQTERFGAEDMKMIRENAMREAYALKRGRFNQAAQLRQQGMNSLAGAFQTTLSMGARAWEVYNQGAGARATATTAATSRAVTASRGTVNMGAVATASGWRP